MNAITYNQYGGPEVLKLTEVDKPTVGDDQVLIAVKAFSLNPYDWHYMRGTPKFMRLDSGLSKPKVKVLGNDIAGIVEAVGKNATQFNSGDEVIASTGLQGFAEFVAVDQEKIAVKPKNMTMSEAACLGIAAITALETVGKFASVKPGQHVLINGASGGVGHYAVQIAKERGAQVTGVCSTKNIEMVKSLGADDVIDYTKDSLVNGKQYDVVMDMIGNLTVPQMNQLARRDGIIAVVGFQGLGNLFNVLLRTMYGKPKLKLVTIKETGEALRTVANLAETGKIKTVIDRAYPLEKTAEGMDYLEQGHASGKVVIEL